MDILENIIAEKKQLIEERKELIPVKLLERSVYFQTPVVSLVQYILRPDKSGVIAEIKRKSPSLGTINPNISVERISIGYMQAGASALSVLTDEKFFGGSNEDLITARKFNYCPILMKDFIIDEYQVIEAKSIGADAILLIVACLDKNYLKVLANLAKSLGLEVLIEIHSKDEANEEVLAAADLIGVNNRNLKTFEVKISTSKELAMYIPQELTKISESGITDPKTILELRQHGYDGFLIGGTFMTSSKPEKACQEFIAKLNEAGDPKAVRT